MADTYHCKGKCGAQRVFTTSDPFRPTGGDRRWTCGRCLALQAARASTYGRAKGGSQIVTNPCPTCGTQMDTAICMFCSQQAINVGTMPAPSKPQRITALDIGNIAKWFRKLPNPMDDFAMPIEPGSVLGRLMDENDSMSAPTYSSCQDHKGEYGTNCIACDNDRAAYRRSKNEG